MRILLWSLVFSAFLFLLNSCGGSSSSNSDENSNKLRIGTIQDGKLKEVLEFYKEEYDLPALGVIITNKSEVLEKSSVGVRDITNNLEVNSNGYWNIGSITKSMTATLSAILVDKKFLDWNTTLSQYFNEFEMLDEYKDITLVELLSHTSGFAQDNDELWETSIEENITRYEFVEEILVYENEEKGKFLYSNINYVIVSAIIEKVMNLSFEEVINEYLFNPLNMQYSFNAKNILGHTLNNNNQWEVANPNIETSNNAKIVTSAGSRTFLTLDSIGYYLKEHLKVKSGETSTLISSENFNKLHTKIVDIDEDLGYSLGWFNQKENELQHSGSNGRWFALTLINPKIGYSYFVVTNSFSSKSQEAVFELMDSLVKRTEN